MTPTFALTPGEPAGVGPELALSALQPCRDARMIVIADAELLQQRHPPGAQWPDIIALDEAHIRHLLAGAPWPAQHWVCWHHPLAKPSRPGQLDAANARYVLATLQSAAELANAGLTDGIITGPVHKGVINDAGVAFSGHTEFFARTAGVDTVVMLLASPGMRVALATTHLPLAEVSTSLTPIILERILLILHRALKQQFGLAEPTIRVLGLNPHAGENSHMGTQERDIMSPVLEKLRRQGLKLQGPVAADTAFGSMDHPAPVDALLAMYHDQGLPVLKFFSFGKATNITLGLPWIRTSVDHGTALDLAGTGQASDTSFRYAIAQALTMARGIDHGTSQ